MPLTATLPLRRAMSAARYHALVLATLLASLAAMSAQGIAVPRSLFALFAAWIVAVLGALAWLRRTRSASASDGVQTALYALDLALLALAHAAAGGAWWLGPTFYLLLVVSAYASLPARRARVIALAALSAFLGLLAAQAAGMIARPPGLPVPSLAGQYDLAAIVGLSGVPALVAAVLIQRALVKALAQARENHRLLLETAEDMVFSFDAEGRFRSVNGAAVRQSGFEREEILGVPSSRFVVPDDLPCSMEHFRAAMRGEARQYEVRFTRKDGAVRWIWCTNTPIRVEGSIVGVLAIVRDVTERKLTAEERERSLSLLRATLDSTADGLLVVDRAGGIITHNQRFAEMWRIPERLMAARDKQQLLDFVHDQLADPEGFLAQIERVYSEPEAESFDVLTFKDGRLFERYSKPQRVSGTAVGRVWSFRDVTQETRAADALARSEASARSLVENAPYGIYRTTTAGRFLAANPALARILGYPSAEALLALNIETDVYCAPAERRKLMAASLGRGFVAPVELEWKRADGTPVIVRLRGQPVRGAGGEVLSWEGFVEDVTALRAAEQALRQSEDQRRMSQRLEAVGQLAGGVAHDFNNLLTVIKAHAEFALADLGASHPQAADVKTICCAADSATALTRQLLAFSRRQVLQPRVLDLNEVVTQFEKMVRRVIPADVAIVTRLAADLGLVEADPGQLEQVLMNLSVNARDAMPGGGTLTIQTENAEVDGSYRSVHWPAAIVPGAHVVLVVTDTGCGMDQTTQARIFEPFFTTKERGHGTGLGLSTVYGIVKQSGGYIWVYSEPGQGTTFRIYLPRASAQAAIPRSDPAPAIAARGSETVLLVEDDALVLRVARRVLAQNGYRVLEAANGAEALRVCAQSAATIDLIVSDLVMPEMGGRELAERVRVHNPSARILFMSGYTEDASFRKDVLQSGEAFLAKPFTPDGLARKVREVLEGGAGSEEQREATAPDGAYRAPSSRNPSPVRRSRR